MKVRPWLAEAIGTFALVFAGCGAIVVDAQFGGVVGHVGIAMTFGLVVMAMIYAIGDASGAHINPAVSLGFWASGRLPAATLGRYVAAQFVGAVIAGLLLWFLFPGAGDFGTTRPAGTVIQGAVMEVVLTFLLMFVILNVATGAKEKGVIAGAAVGGTVALAALFGGPVSGASMNPARSLGPALVSLDLGHLWVYFLAPAAGAVLAVPACRLACADGCCESLEAA